MTLFFSMVCLQTTQPHVIYLQTNTFLGMAALYLVQPQLESRVYWQSIATLRKTDWSVRHMESFFWFFLSSCYFIVLLLLFISIITYKIRDSVPSNPAFLSFISWKWLEREILGSLRARVWDLLWLDYWMAGKRCCADISFLFLFIRAKCWKH